MCFVIRMFKGTFTFVYTSSRQGTNQVHRIGLHTFSTIYVQPNLNDHVSYFCCQPLSFTYIMNIHVGKLYTYTYTQLACR